MLAVACCLLPAVASHAQEWKESPFHREGFYFGIAGAYLFDQGLGNYLEDAFDEVIGAYNLGRVDPSSPVKSIDVSSGSSVGINARGGYRFLPWLAAELQLEYVPPIEADVQVFNSSLQTIPGQTFQRVVDTLREEMQSTHELFTSTINLKFLFPMGRIQPYALGGAGLVYSQTTGSYLSYCTQVQRCKRVNPRPIDVGTGALEDGISFGFRAGGGLDLYLTESVLFNWEATAVIPIGTLQHLNYYSFIWGLQYRF